MKKRTAQSSLVSTTVELLDIPEVARRLKVGRTTVYSLIKHYGLPALTVGTVKRVSLASLERWIQQREEAS